MTKYFVLLMLLTACNHQSDIGEIDCFEKQHEEFSKMTQNLESNFRSTK